jgi:hypothetical protein
MRTSPKAAWEELKREARSILNPDRRRLLAKYVHDPVGYGRDILGIEHITPDQEKIARALCEPPYRVFVKSGHNIGKTFLAAWLTNWWYDTRNPGVAITTAPTERDVLDLLWTEVRLQRDRQDMESDFTGAVAPEMRSSPEHYAKGYTARKGESFQGRHRPNMFFLFDEAEGVDARYWLAASTMFQPDGTNAWLVILNPTTNTSQSYQEERAVHSDGTPKWKVFTISALDHPNVLAGLEGKPAPIPSAVSLAQVRDWMEDWFEPVTKDEVDEDLDVEFPIGSGEWWRPDPDGEARVLGRRPSSGTFGVWSEKAWQRISQGPGLAILITDIPEIGCDVARFGDDRTEMHVRAGCCSLHHEDHGGWDTVRTADRLMAMADEWAAWATRRQDKGTETVNGKSIRIKVDDTGVGGGVTDILAANGFNVVPVNAGVKATRPDKYPRVRDELWFETRLRAKQGRLDLARLEKRRLLSLEVQALAPTWKPLPNRTRQVESKEDTKDRLGRSPDGMDAVNLAYFDGFVWKMPEKEKEDAQRLRPRHESVAARRRMFGVGIMETQFL